MTYERLTPIRLFQKAHLRLDVVMVEVKFIMNFEVGSIIATGNSSNYLLIIQDEY